MSIQQPQSADKLNSPDHAMSHRVFANDNAAPNQAIVVAANGNVGIGTDSPDRQFKVMGSGTQAIEIKSSNGTSQMILNGGSNQIARFLFQECGSNRWFVSSDGTDSDKFKITDGSQNEIFVLTDAGTKSDVSINQGDFFIQNSGNIGIGTTSPTNLLSLGGESARVFWMEREETANTAGNTLTVQAGGATAAATDKAGGDLIIQPGVSTGNAESGVQIKGCVAGVAGTADRTLTIAMRVLGNKIGFYNVAPVARQVLATGGGATVDNVITALQNLGLVSQS